MSKIRNKLKENVKKLKTDIPALFIAFSDKETPISARIMAGIIIVYALSPIDLIPDFVPVLGYLDDLFVLPLLVTLAVKLIPKNVWERCKEAAENMWADGKPKKWYYGIPVILVWVLVIAIIVRIVFGVVCG